MINKSTLYLQYSIVHAYLCLYSAEIQIEASKKRISDLEEQIRIQPMSAKDAQELHQNIEDAEDMLHKNQSMQHESGQRVAELQMLHNRYYSWISVTKVQLIIIMMFWPFPIQDCCID